MGSAGARPRGRARRESADLRRNGGFTLLELLVTLVVVGILCMAVGGVLRNAIGSIDQATAALDNLTRMRSLELVLGEALRDARALQLSQEEINYLEEDGAYDSAEGDYRYRGEAEALGFCLDRPFLSAERDGCMHWVLLEVRYDEKTDAPSLWLTDVSFLNGIDNPVGEDWGDNAMFGEVAVLPTREECLLKEVESIRFSHWQLDETDMTGEPEPLELEEDEVEGDYALEVPDYIEMEIKLPKMDAETLVFDYAVRRNGI